MTLLPRVALEYAASRSIIALLATTAPMRSPARPSHLEKL
jgi:hypothetical protein